jgi:hypothetical protein
VRNSKSRLNATARVAVLLTLFALCASAQTAIIETGPLQLSFNDANGALESVVHMPSGFNFLEKASQLWTLHPLDAPEIAPDNADSFSWTPQDGGIQLSWTGFGIEAAPGLRVVVRVSPLDETPGATAWRICVDGIDRFPLRAVRFPRLDWLAKQPGERVAVPVWMGQMTANARDLFSRGGSPHRSEWEYPGLLSIQLEAAYGGQAGIYLSCRDTAALRKQFALYGDGNGALGIDVTHLPEAAKGTGTYQTSYDTVVGIFNGDWYTAADIYRNWATDQHWARESRLRRGATPSWVLDTGIWVWNRGRSNGVLDPAVSLQEQTGLPTSVFWHWWHGCPYDAGFPEYLPPREGEDAFKSALSAAHQAGVHALVYMNQRLWGMSTSSWANEGAERWAVKGPDGKVRPEVYNTFTKSPCASMCMGTPFWRAKYAGLAEAAVNQLGVDGIYMDQACSSLACYDPAHNHPLGGGSYWMAGFRDLETDIRARCSGVTLAGEGCGEAWLPYLDLMLSLQVSQERYMPAGEWEPIPFFHAVYHDCAVFYGNYSSLTRPPYDDLWPPEFAPGEPLKLLDAKYARQFRLEQARAFVWGQQPTVANFSPEHFESRPDEMAYAVNLAKLRARARKYLLHGKFLRPPTITPPRETLAMSRLSIYAGQHDAVKEFQMESPLVLASAWQAPDGQIAFVFANIADHPINLRIPLDRTAYNLPGQADIHQLQPNGERNLVATYAPGQDAVEMVLNPGPTILEFK